MGKHTRISRPILDDRSLSYQLVGVESGCTAPPMTGEIRAFLEKQLAAALKELASWEASEWLRRKRDEAVKWRAESVRDLKRAESVDAEISELYAHHARLQKFVDECAAAGIVAPEADPDS